MSVCMYRCLTTYKLLSGIMKRYKTVQNERDPGSGVKKC